MIVQIKLDILELVHRMELELLKEPNPVRRQQAIEVMTARWAAGMEDQAGFVADSIHKHVRQLLSGDAYRDADRV